MLQFHTNSAKCRLLHVKSKGPWLLRSQDGRSSSTNSGSTPTGTNKRRFAATDSAGSSGLTADELQPKRHKKESLSSWKGKQQAPSSYKQHKAIAVDISSRALAVRKLSPSKPKAGESAATAITKGANKGENTYKDDVYREEKKECNVFKIIELQKHLQGGRKTFALRYAALTDAEYFRESGELISRAGFRGYNLFAPNNHEPTYDRMLARQAVWRTSSDPVEQQQADVNVYHMAMREWLMKAQLPAPSHTKASASKESADATTGIQIGERGGGARVGRIRAFDLANDHCVNAQLLYPRKLCFIDFDYQCSIDGNRDVSALADFKLALDRKLLADRSAVAITWAWRGSKVDYYKQSMNTVLRQAAEYALAAGFVAVPQIRELRGVGVVIFLLTRVK